MPRVALALLFFSFAGVADAQSVAQAPADDAPARAGGWVRDDYGVWRHVDGAYHVAYLRRGCRVEEDWDGLRYTAQVRCRPGVKPN